MSRTTAFANDLAALLYNATPIANIADDAASSPLTDLYLSLHTSNPGDSGDQTTSECAYTSYARVAVARTSGGFTVADNVVSLASTEAFPTCTGPSDDELATYFAVGSASSGAGVILHYGPLTPSVQINNGTTPKLGAGTTITFVTAVSGA